MNKLTSLIASGALAASLTGCSTFQQARNPSSNTLHLTSKEGEIGLPEITKYGIKLYDENSKQREFGLLSLDRKNEVNIDSTPIWPSSLIGAKLVPYDNSNEMITRDGHTLSDTNETYYLVAIKKDMKGKIGIAPYVPSNDIRIITSENKGLEREVSEHYTDLTFKEVIDRSRIDIKDVSLEGIGKMHYLGTDTTGIPNSLQAVFFEEGDVEPYTFIQNTLNENGEAKKIIQEGLMGKFYVPVKGKELPPTPVSQERLEEMAKFSEPLVED